MKKQSSLSAMKFKYKNLCMCCLFHRYLYYVKNKPIISDKKYDELELNIRILEKFKPKLAHKKSPTKVPGSDNPWDYPRNVRGFAEDYYKEFLSDKDVKTQKDKTKDVLLMMLKNRRSNGL